MEPINPTAIDFWKGAFDVSFSIGLLCLGIYITFRYFRERLNKKDEFIKEYIKESKVIVAEKEVEIKRLNEVIRSDNARSYEILIHVTDILKEVNNSNKDISKIAKETLDLNTQIKSTLSLINTVLDRIAKIK